MIHYFILYSIDGIQDSIDIFYLGSSNGINFSYLINGMVVIIDSRYELCSTILNKYFKGIGREFKELSILEVREVEVKYIY